MFTSNFGYSFKIYRIYFSEIKAVQYYETIMFSIMQFLTIIFYRTGTLLKNR